jgi:hypothetical protein
LRKVKHKAQQKLKFIAKYKYKTLTIEKRLLPRLAAQAERLDLKIGTLANRILHKWLRAVEKKTGS